jgi:phosphohistidine phosphatase
VRLWLLRHAKSSWEDPGLPDERRPLATRGVRAAAAMRDYLTREPIRPSLVLCSSALRARQTLAAVLPSLGDELELRIERSLYTFDGGALLVQLQRLTSGRSTLVVGHNPAMQELAVAVAARGERLGDLSRKFPTGALAEIELPSDRWGDLAGGTGTLTRFVVPRELA